MVWLFRAILALETVLFYGGLWWAFRVDNINLAEKALIASWKRYFKEEVQSSWIFSDGVGL